MEIKDIENWEHEDLSDQESEAVSGGHSSESLFLGLAFLPNGSNPSNPGNGGSGGPGPHGLLPG